MKLPMLMAVVLSLGVLPAYAADPAPAATKPTTAEQLQDQVKELKAEIVGLQTQTQLLIQQRNQALDQLTAIQAQAAYQNARQQK